MSSLPHDQTQNNVQEAAGRVLAAVRDQCVSIADAGLERILLHELCKVRRAHGCGHAQLVLEAINERLGLAGDVMRGGAA